MVLLHGTLDTEIVKGLRAGGGAGPAAEGASAASEPQGAADGRLLHDRQRRCDGVAASGRHLPDPHVDGFTCILESTNTF